MTRPTVSPTTERVFSRLPAYIQAADEAEPSGGGWPLLRWLSLVGDQEGDVEQLLDRIMYVPPDEGGTPGDTSDLVDPATADDGWLPWLAQLVGIDPGPGGGASQSEPYGTLTLDYPTYQQLDDAFTSHGDQLARTTPPAVTLGPAELRAAIANPSQSWLAGSTSSIEDVVRPLLTGSRAVTVIPNNGGPWEVAVVTYAGQTPDQFAILPAIARAGVKPAGVHLTYVLAAAAVYFTLSRDWATYADFSAGFATYAAAAAYVPPGG